MNTISSVSQQEFLDTWKDVLVPHGFGYRLRLLSQLQARRFQERLTPYGLTPFHWLVLCCLWIEDGLATSTICDRLEQVGGTLTGVLDRMEERGLVRRERDPSDRRIWRIWLTEDGEKFKDILPPIVRELKEESMAGISTPERETLSRLLDRAIANLS